MIKVPDLDRKKSNEAINLSNAEVKGKNYCSFFKRISMMKSDSKENHFDSYQHDHICPCQKHNNEVCKQELLIEKESNLNKDISIRMS